MWKSQTFGHAKLIYDTQRNDTHRNDKQCNDTQRNDTQRNDTQRNDTQRKDTHIIISTTTLMYDIEYILRTAVH